MKKVSIIIPCYNVEKTIETSLECLVNQTIGIENLEIILVDDASSDNTLEILNGWKNKYPDSIIVIPCKENGKQGRARNIGLTYATGEYIGFIDGDDYAEKEMYETLYSDSDNGKYDLVVCQSVRRYINESKSVSESIDEKIAISSIDDRNLFLKRDINKAIWNKIYKRELLISNKIQFPEGIDYEDIYFSELVKLYCSNVYICGKTLYHHIIWNDSVSNGPRTPDKVIDYIDVHMQLIEELKNRGLYLYYQEYYDRSFMIAYITFVTMYESNFGRMPVEMKQVFINTVKELLPNFRSIEVVKSIIETRQPAECVYIIEELIK